MQLTHKNRNNKTALLILTALVFTGAVFWLSLCTGRYPLTFSALFSGDPGAVNVFFTLRLPRTVMAFTAGFGLGAAGMVYQLIFKNPLASPDIIGVSSGASAGAASAILFFHASAAGITAFAFAGGLAAVFLSLGLSFLSDRRSISTMVLSGIAVSALAQAFLMTLKFTADPERELASIEYWIMGSLGSVTAKSLPLPVVITALGVTVLAVFFRQILMLSLDEDEAQSLGVPVALLRLLALTVATLIVAAIVSVTGLISFTGLLAPHTARLLTKDSRVPAFFLSGILGGALLLASDIIARSAASGEMPVSILTSAHGAPFLLWLIFKGGSKWTSS